MIPTVYPVLAADARLAVALFGQYASQGVTARDIIHVAVMRNNGLTTVISTDAHFDHIAGVTRLDPQDLFNQSQSQGTVSP